MTDEGVDDFEANDGVAVNGLGNAGSTHNNASTPAPEAPSRRAEGLRHAYSEVLTEVRHYSSLRFAIFTLFFAVVGALFSAAFGFFEIKGAGSTKHVHFMVRVGGLIVTLLFLLYELRIQALINHGIRTGVELESELGYTLLSKRPPWRWYRSHYATIAFFTLLIALWIWLLIQMSHVSTASNVPQMVSGEVEHG
jgi:hypothetical protein